jgi:hypothetical protein
MQFEEIKKKKEFNNLFKKEKKLKVDFHGNRDLYNFIKGIAIRTAKLSSFDENEVISIINNYIERNFGGIDYEIDIDLDLKLTDIEDEIKSISEILKEYIPDKKIQKKKKNEKKGGSGKNDKKEKSEKLKVSSVFLFKKIYNMTCDKENETQFKIIRFCTDVQCSDRMCNFQSLRFSQRGS